MTQPVSALMLIDGRWVGSTETRRVTNPYDGALLGDAPESSLADLDSALNSAVRASADVAAMPPFERAALLRRLGQALRDNADRLASVITAETGKPLSDARGESIRSAHVFDLCAEEAVRIEGEQVPMDASALGAGKLAVTWRFPVGVVAAITPFNAPVFLACHKIAPAIAAGNAVVMKGPPQADLSTYALSQVLAEAGMPAGWVNYLYGHTVAEPLVRDERVGFISFTGSPRVGARIKASSGLRRVALELGGTGPNIIAEDADLDAAMTACARNSMRLSGQSCLSVQNVYVHDSLFERFRDGFLKNARALKVGDPQEKDTDVGTLINEKEAIRIESWINEAVDQGATLLMGGARRGAVVEPTVITDATPAMRVVSEEVFGPVAVLHRYRDLDEVFGRINDTPYGLHCGIFTSDLTRAFAAARRLRFGGIVINGSSTWRTDQMPYGGVKDSGIGREGPRYSIRDMTEERLVIFNV